MLAIRVFALVYDLSFVLSDFGFGLGFWFAIWLVRARFGCSMIIELGGRRSGQSNAGERQRRVPTGDGAPSAAAHRRRNVSGCFSTTKRALPNSRNFVKTIL